MEDTQKAESISAAASAVFLVYYSCPKPALQATVLLL